MLSTLLLAPLPKPIGGSSSSILIRESYKLTFDHVWARAMSAPWHGVVLTGQPGIGGHILFPLSLLQILKSSLKARHSSNTTSLCGFCSANRSCSSPWTVKSCFYSTMIRSIRRSTPAYYHHYNSLEASHRLQMFLSGRCLISTSGVSRGDSCSTNVVSPYRRLHRIQSDTRAG